MILIIASRHDRAARVLAERWKDQDARIMTCRDLSTAGWRFYADRPHASYVAVGNQVIAASEVAGVLMRLPWVTDDELTQIRPTDRTYAAAEICAFLVAWLSKTAFPVLNRPSPSCLMGPSWGEAQWIYHAARAGMRVLEGHSKNLSEALRNNEVAGPLVAATVVGERCIGPIAPNLAAQARRLAQAARVDLLTVQFTSAAEDAQFVQAFLSADLSQPDAADAILDCFHESPAIHL